MKHSARAIIRRAEIPLLAVIVLYKAATNLLFVPLMQQLWSLTLRFAPMHYLSNNNASDIFSSPAIILCITLIAILTAFWALYEFSVLLHGLDLARKGETIPCLPCCAPLLQISATHSCRRTGSFWSTVPC